MASESQQRSHSLGQQEQQIQKSKDKDHDRTRAIGALSPRDLTLIQFFLAFGSHLDRKEKGCFGLKRAFFCH